MSSKVEQIAANWIQLLPQFYNSMNKTNASPKKQSELTHLQFHILEELFQEKAGISMTQLAKNISISKQQLTPLINKLEELDFVVKVQDNSDKRVMKLNLSKEGSRIVSKRWEEFHAVLCDRLSNLSGEDLIDLDYAISKLNRILNKIE
ncbi:MarR family transcriptional regulator [Neobacillus sp. PS3-40]|uniref:MarR family winged helix-turn-helix transcriptional regulator n=1 Tax=Neobacillus sp. PS3-40 TaxID=3070679 RepID=UPI0027DFFC0F|nr:MarR family transcriptional regulator [Neobacillus sp. PS3-40]WML46342.1 MarR family transcriptional regulator [Neobacillus sp. PS3-40]